MFTIGFEGSVQDRIQHTFLAVLLISQMHVLSNGEPFKRELISTTVENIVRESKKQSYNSCRTNISNFFFFFFSCPPQKSEQIFLTIWKTQTIRLGKDTFKQVMSGEMWHIKSPHTHARKYLPSPFAQWFGGKRLNRWEQLNHISLCKYRSDPLLTLPCC